MDKESNDLAKTSYTNNELNTVWISVSQSFWNIILFEKKDSTGKISYSLI